MISDIDGKNKTLSSKKTKKEENLKMMDLRKIFGDGKNVKTSFSDLQEMKSDNMRKKIERYQEVTINNDICLFGSRRCAEHHTKLVREVTKKRVSVISKDGTLERKLCHPAVRGTQSVRGDRLYDELKCSANKRAWIDLKENK